MTYRKASDIDLETLVQLRVDFIKEMHPEYTPEQLTPIRRGVEAYIKDGYRHGTFRSYICETEDDEIVGSAGVLIYSLPPLQSETRRKVGHILNFFVYEHHRGNGYGSNLMEFVKQSARDEGITRLVLNSTEMGYRLYKRAGSSEPEFTYMRLEL